MKGWVEDLSHLIRHLQLSSYHILSVSGGTGYALAAAMLLPREQLRGVGIAFGAAPWEAGTQGLSLMAKVGVNVSKRFPGVLEWVWRRAMEPAFRDESPEKAAKLVRQLGAYGPPEDRAEMEKEGMSEGLVKLFREVWRQGSEGPTADFMSGINDWGFKLEEVQYPGIRLFYGTKDVNTPPAMGKYMAARLPQAVYKEYEGKSHFTMWNELEEMLGDMLRDG
jgi:pimeloyl-ACP methyl ester carboxylesterase